MTAPEVKQDAVQEYAQQQEANQQKNWRALEQRLKQEQEARLQAERRAEEAERQAKQRHITEDDDDDDTEPYVDHKRLNKKLSSFEKSMEQKIEEKAELIARNMVEKKRQEDYIKQNPDFYDILQKHADELANKDPDLADSILQMPDTFERQKLVYKNIKALGLHKPATPQTSIQDKIDANRRSPYYQPSGVATAPYSAQGDFSQVGQEQAYKKMKELQQKMRLR